jgi:polar amino acid transport system substrate-binding protein
MALLLVWGASAEAACSRVMRVPVAAIGLSVTASGGAVGGVYPDVLRRIEADSGCRFEFSVVPRARLEAMFIGGQADLLLPATRTPARDARGHFVPMGRARAV